MREVPDGVFVLVLVLVLVLVVLAVGREPRHGNIIDIIDIIDESESEPLPTPVFSSFCSHCSEKRLLRTEGIYVAKECVPGAPCSWPPSSATTRFAKLSVVALLPHMSASVSGFGAAFGAKFVFVTALLPGMAQHGSVFLFSVRKWWP